LQNLGFFDRGGSIVIWCAGALGGLVASVVVGPRYGKFMKKADVERIKGGGKDHRKKTLPALLEDAFEETVEVDELFLRKVRKLIKEE
jgi:ammonia channel protein AmtB